MWKWNAQIENSSNANIKYTSMWHDAVTLKRRYVYTRRYDVTVAWTSGVKIQGFEDRSAYIFRGRQFKRFWSCPFKLKAVRPSDSLQSGTARCYGGTRWAQCKSHPNWGTSSRRNAALSVRWLDRSEPLLSLSLMSNLIVILSTLVFRFLYKSLHISAYACCIVCPFYIPLIHYHNNIWLNKLSVKLLTCGFPVLRFVPLS